MTFTNLQIKGLVLISPDIYRDKRGHFFEACNTEIEDYLKVDFVQDNQAFRVKDTIVGLHYQTEPLAQGKLIRVLEGAIKDVVVDMRPESETFMHSYSVYLSEPSEEGYQMFYIPPGFAHGFSVLSDGATVLYKCTNPYSKEHERGINPLSYHSWDVDTDRAIISDKDLALPRVQL